VSVPADPSSEVGSLSGRVHRTSGAPIPFARLRIQGLDDPKAPTKDLQADENGQFRVPALASGRYELQLLGQRHTNGERSVTVVIKAGENTQDFVEPDRVEGENAIPAPYGAPPARRRTV